MSAVETFAAGGVKWVRRDGKRWMCHSTDPSMSGSFQAVGLPAWGGEELIGLTATDGLSAAGSAALEEILARHRRLKVLTPPTRVCSVRKMTLDEFRASRVVYVGRTYWKRDGLKRGEVLYPEHPLHNPYPLKKGAGAAQRRACIDLFRGHLAANKAALLPEVKKLQGCLLGCWCGDYDGVGETNLLCHAVVLARAADGLEVF